MKRERQFEGLRQVGGHPAVDLLNTVEYRGRPEHGDRLTSVDHLLAWCQLAGLIDENESDYLHQLARENPDAGERSLHEVAQLREQAREGLAGKLKGCAEATAMKVLQQRIESAARRVQVVVEGGGIGFKRKHQISGFDSLVDRIALSIEDAFAVAAHQPLRECEGGNCDWLFFDRSRSGQRRWCHPGQCGNAQRVRNFRARRPGRSPKAAAER